MLNIFQLVQQSLKEDLINIHKMTVSEEVLHHATSLEIAQATLQEEVPSAPKDIIEEELAVITQDLQHDAPKLKMVSVGTQLTSRPLPYRSKSKYEKITLSYL